MLGEHRESPYCGCWGCIQLAEKSVGVCVVHLMASPYDVQVPRAMPGLNLCGECNDRMIADLRFVAERWDEAQEALHSGSGGGGSERHAQRIEAPVPINVAVSDALLVARDNIWSVVLRLVDDHGVRLPEDQTTPSLAEWLSRRQAVKIAESKDKMFTKNAYWWIADAADWIATASYGQETSVEIPEQYCKRPGCGAQLHVVETRAGTHIVRCSGDSKHAVQWDTWSQMLRARKPRRARPPKLGRV